MRLKLEKTEDVYAGACYAKKTVVFSMGEDESNRVRGALKVVELLKQRAMKASKIKKEDADLTEFGFSQDGRTVTITIEQGAIG